MQVLKCHHWVQFNDIFFSTLPACMHYVNLQLSPCGSQVVKIISVHMFDLQGLQNC